MTPNTVTATLQRGFRLTLGATATLIEVLQDPQTSNQRFSDLSSDVSHLAETLENKGEVTEREARQLVDDLLRQWPNPFAENTASPMATVDTVATPIADPTVQSDLAALTQELAEIRQVIDALKAKNP